MASYWQPLPRPELSLRTVCARQMCTMAMSLCTSVLDLRKDAATKAQGADLHNK